jgi:hypothetical protein
MNNVRRNVGKTVIYQTLSEDFWECQLLSAMSMERIQSEKCPCP